MITTLLIAAGLALVLSADGAYAQLFPGFCSACVQLVFDASVYQETAIIATSVTTGGGGGEYQSNAAYISSLDQTLFSGVNAQNFGNEFPGWQALPPNAADIASAITKTTLQTYGAALALAQSQEQELEGEDFTNIETTLSTTTNLLTATQATGEAVLQNNKEQQYTRQLLAAILTVEATKAGEELNERSQRGATTAKSFNFGVNP